MRVTPALRIAAAFLLLSTLSACERGPRVEKFDAEDIREGKGPIKNLPMMTPAEVPRELQQAIRQSVELAPVEPYPAEVLVPFLPDVADWEAGAAQSGATEVGRWQSSSGDGGFPATEVQRAYRHAGPDGETSLRVRITDGGFAPTVYMEFQGNQAMAQPPAGKTAVKEVAGEPAYLAAGKSGQVLGILVAHRFFVTLEATGTSTDLASWAAGSLRLGELAALGHRAESAAATPVATP